MLHFVVIMEGVECSCTFHISRALCCYWMYEVFLKFVFSMFSVQTDTNRSPSKCTFSREGLKHLGGNHVIIIIIIIIIIINIFHG